MVLSEIVELALEFVGDRVIDRIGSSSDDEEDEAGNDEGSQGEDGDGDTES